MKITRKLTHEELAKLFIKINTGVTVLNWNPLIKDKCEFYADTTQPIIKVDLEGGSWLRVYVDKEYNEITWY